MTEFLNAVTVQGVIVGLLIGLFVGAFAYEKLANRK